MRHLRLVMLISAIPYSSNPLYSQTTPPPEPIRGVAISYSIPSLGPLPQTYLVTLAAVDAKNPKWIVSEFLPSAVRTVTAQNKGHFTDYWNGLDDNFMPVPPGTYGIKGIFMPAARWKIDNQYHAIVARYAGMPDSWAPKLDQDGLPPVASGDPVGTALYDVAVGPNGVANFYFGYMENAQNNYMMDLNKPIGYEQFLRSYPSGSAAGGTCTTTDGETVWSFSTDLGPKFVYRADQMPFGKGAGAGRRFVTNPRGWVTGMASYRDQATGTTFVYLAERGGIGPGPSDVELSTVSVNTVETLDGSDGHKLGDLPIYRPRSAKVSGHKLYVLHETPNGGLEVSAAPLAGGIPSAPWQTVLEVPTTIAAFDCVVDRSGNLYLSDPEANKVYKFGPSGNLLLEIGRLPHQESGHYDPLTLMAPEKLSVWTDAQGLDRLLVVEMGGPNRISEWGSDGRLVREFLPAQTHANEGYAPDPSSPDEIYLQGQGGWLDRFHVDYVTGKWTVDAVYPNVSGTYPKLISLNGIRYLVFQGSRVTEPGQTRSIKIYRQDGDRWILSAGITTRRIGGQTTAYYWRDKRGDGSITPEEMSMTPTEAFLTSVIPYFGSTVLDDLSFVVVGSPTSGMSQATVYRLAPTGFDSFGNPDYDPNGWKELWSDPVFAAKAAGTAPALYGGNEVGTGYTSDWTHANTDGARGYYLFNRSGPNLSANFGGQVKLMRFVPDGRGGQALQWRVGRVALGGQTALPGEMYGGIFVDPPVNHLVGVVDNSQAGYDLFTDDGMYVDTILPDPRSLSRNQMGTYNIPAEFFAGRSYVGPSGQVYLAFGKTEPILYALEGWTTASNPVHRLVDLPTSITIAADQIAPPTPAALALRGNLTLTVAQIAPATGGGPAIDGTTSGWESAYPITFQASPTQTVEARCLYDPDTLYVRIHARVGHKFEPTLLTPADHFFTHDRDADTVSLYLQADPAAKPAANSDGRAGDIRIVFGLISSGATIRPVAIGLYKQWKGQGPARPITYRSPVGSVSFENVAVISDASLWGGIDKDGEGFTIAAAVPRSALAPLPRLNSQISTMLNFDATFGSQLKFWWSNADGSASIEMSDQPSEARLYPGSWAQAVLEPISLLPIRAWQIIGPFGDDALRQTNYDQDRALVLKILSQAVFPPQQSINLGASYTGTVATTRTASRTLKWKDAEVPDGILHLDTALQWNGWMDEGTAYVASWIYSPRPTHVMLSTVDGHGWHSIHVWVNSLPVLGTGDPANLRSNLQPNTPVQLNAGWNSLLVRYDLIYGSMTLGVVLSGNEGDVWQLRFAPRLPTYTPAPNYN